MEERHRHRYEVNPSVVKDLEEKGMRFVGHSTDGQRMEIMELQGKLCYGKAPRGHSVVSVVGMPHIAFN